MNHYEALTSIIDTDEALCTTTDPDAFFEETSSDALLFAVKLCKSCPVQQECLEAALSIPYLDDYGVWGGTTRTQRRRMRITRNKQNKLSRGSLNDPHHIQGETN